jgi:hypothetical protein
MMEQQYIFPWKAIIEEESHVANDPAIFALETFFFIYYGLQEILRNSMGPDPIIEQVEATISGLAGYRLDLAKLFATSIQTCITCEKEAVHYEATFTDGDKSFLKKQFDDLVSIEQCIKGSLCLLEGNGFAVDTVGALVEENHSENDRPPQNIKELHKIAIMNEAGMFDKILSHLSPQGQPGPDTNFRSAAELIGIVTGIKVDTVRRCLEAIYKASSSHKNHPYHNRRNEETVLNLLKRFGLNRM